MSMFNITGKVMKTYFQEGKEDKETGDKEEGKMKVQIMGDMPVRGGDSKLDLVTLTVPDELDFESLKGKEISVPLGFFSPAKGQIVYFIPKGSMPMVRAEQNL